MRPTRTAFAAWLVVSLVTSGCTRENPGSAADARGETDARAETAAVDVPSDVTADLPREVRAETHDTQGSEAETTGCPPWALIFVDGACQECTSDAPCGCGSCGDDHRCWEGEGSCACPDPYFVGCAFVDYETICVECFVDSDCPIGCGCSEHDCFRSDGSWCERRPSGCASDCTAAGCPDAEGHWSDLQCDPAAGCCTSPDARCDDRAAFCTQAGARCMRLRDAFGISFATWLEGPAACDRFAKGYCTCDPDAQADCATAAPGTVPGCCPPDQSCVAATELFHRWVGDPAAEPPVDPTGWAFCVLETARTGD